MKLPGGVVADHADVGRAHPEPGRPAGDDRPRGADRSARRRSTSVSTCPYSGSIVSASTIASGLSSPATSRSKRSALTRPPRSARASASTSGTSASTARALDPAGMQVGELLGRGGGAERGRRPQLHAGDQTGGEPADQRVAAADRVDDPLGRRRGEAEAARRPWRARFPRDPRLSQTAAAPRSRIASVIAASSASLGAGSSRAPSSAPRLGEVRRDQVRTRGERRRERVRGRAVEDRERAQLASRGDQAGVKVGRGSRAGGCRRPRPRGRRRRASASAETSRSASAAVRGPPARGPRPDRRRRRRPACRSPASRRRPGRRRPRAARRRAAPAGARRSGRPAVVIDRGLGAELRGDAGRVDRPCPRASRAARRRATTPLGAPSIRATRSIAGLVLTATKAGAERPSIRPGPPPRPPRGAPRAAPRQRRRR